MEIQRFHKILCANRGEIAIRIFRACTELGRKTVAIFSAQDATHQHRYKAHEAYLVGKGRKPVDAFVVAMGIRRLDGLAAARRIRAVQAAIGVAPPPLIALTANAAEEDRLAAEAAGFAAFFVKPFDAQALTREVARLAHAQPAREEALGA